MATGLVIFLVVGCVREASFFTAGVVSVRGALAVTLLVVVYAFRVTVSVVKVFAVFFTCNTTNKPVLRTTTIALLIVGDTLTPASPEECLVACCVLFAHIATLEPTGLTVVVALSPTVYTLSLAGLITVLVVCGVRIALVLATC